MFQVTITRIRCIKDTSGLGNDEPYIIVFAADLNKTLLVPQSGATLYGPYEDMNDEDIWGEPVVDISDPAFWGFDGTPRAITDPKQALILIVVCESDHDQAFSNTVRTTVLAGVKGLLASYVASGTDPATMATQLRKDMEGFVDLGIRTDIEHDERLGDVQIFALTQADLDAASTGSVDRVVVFTSGAEDSEYHLTVQTKGQVGSTSSPLTIATEQLRYAALWEQQSGTPWIARHGMSADEYQQEFDQQIQQGFRLVQVNATVANGVDVYAAIWDKKPGPEWIARHRMSSAQYQDEFTRLAKEGYRLTHVSGYGAEGKDFYAAIWQKKSGPEWVARHGMTSAQYQTEFSARVKEGYRLVHVCGYGIGSGDRYAAIWEKKAGSEWIARHRMTAMVYQQEFDALAAQGYRLVHVSAYTADGTDLYAAIWEKSGGPAWIARHRMTDAAYQTEFTTRARQGYRLVTVSACPLP